MQRSIWSIKMHEGIWYQGVSMVKIWGFETCPYTRGSRSIHIWYVMSTIGLRSQNVHWQVQIPTVRLKLSTVVFWMSTVRFKNAYHRIQKCPLSSNIPTIDLKLSIVVLILPFVVSKLTTVGSKMSIGRVQIVCCRIQSIRDYCNKPYAISTRLVSWKLSIKRQKVVQNRNATKKR